VSTGGPGADPVQGRLADRAYGVAMALKPDHPTIYPALRYADARAAVKFLCDAFGLTEHSVVEGPGGTISHAELAWGTGLVMLGDRGAEPSPYDTERVVLYLAVDDPDAHYERTTAAGAEIVMGLTDQPYGSREYAAKDPEGNVWCFGTYQPGPTDEA
jgi:uncharacterized glyoxalase superfamily protein PhnB